MDKWEYKRIEVKADADLVPMLNQHGADGWEAFSIERVKGEGGEVTTWTTPSGQHGSGTSPAWVGYVVILKRRKQ